MWYWLFWDCAFILLLLSAICVSVSGHFQFVFVCALTFCFNIYLHVSLTRRDWFLERDRKDHILFAWCMIFALYFSQAQPYNKTSLCTFWEKTHPYLFIYSMKLWNAWVSSFQNMVILNLCGLPFLAVVVFVIDPNFFI